jgi:DNA-binding NtrC family response regulator
VLERAVLLSAGEWIEPRDLRFDYTEATGPPGPATDLTLLELERRHIERVLQEEGGRVDPTARRLGIPRSTLYQKLKRLGLRSSEEVPPE